MENLTGKSCLLCGKTKLVKKYSSDQFSVLLCISCNFGFTYPMPTENQLQEFYSSNYFSNPEDPQVGYKHYVEDVDIHTINAKSIFKKLKRFWKKNPGTILDVGCAHGFLLNYARSKGWIVKGVDFSKEAVDYAVNELKLDVKLGNIFDLKLPDKSINVCVAIGVIDHLVDPFSVIEEIHRILTEDGILLFTIGDIGGYIPFHYKPPEHLYYFSRKSLNRLLEKRYTVKNISVYYLKYSMKEFLVRLKTYIKILIIPKWLYNLPIILKIPSNEIIVIAKKK